MPENSTNSNESDNSDIHAGASEHDGAGNKDTGSGTEHNDATSVPELSADELTDEESAELLPPNTGNSSTQFLILGLAVVIVSSLGVMLRLITNKRKFEE